MDSQIDLEPVIRLNCTESQAPIIDIIKTCLHSLDETPSRAAKLCEELRKFGASKRSREDISSFCWDLWMIVADIAHLTPPDHPWQDVLVQAVRSLQQKGGLVGPLGDDDGLDLDWKDLPHLASYMLDKWFDPTELDEWTLEDASRWKNLNSFAARLTTDSFAPWLTFPTWQLRSALEEKLDKGSILDIRVWVATEWILRCGEIVFRDIASQEPLEEDTAKALSTGPLCTGVSTRSVERLDFWRKRLLEIADQKEALQLDAEVVDRATRAAEEISKFESSRLDITADSGLVEQAQGLHLSVASKGTKSSDL